jgi:hypothetical protein
MGEREREMNHIATGRASALGENYSLLIIGDSNIEEDGGEVDGDGGGGDGVDRDGSGSTSPSRQGTGTETSVPQNSSMAAAELHNSFSKNTDRSRVFLRKAFYRRRGSVRGPPGGLTTP